MIASILLLVSSAFLASAEEYHFNIENKCPDQENIPKCSCIVNDEGIHVTCTQFDTDKEIQDHLKEFRGYVLNKLQISNYYSFAIPTDLFSGLKINYLSLKYIDEENGAFSNNISHFQGLEESLRTLEITKSFAGGSPLFDLKLGHLKNLEEVILEENEIAEVGNNWFQSDLVKLSVLIFEQNGIEVLGKTAFSSLSNLKLLVVAGNYIEVISRSMFPKSALRLITLDLAYNRISTLPDDIFSGMPSLQEINLDKNLITTIEEGTWSPVFSQLVALRLKGNPLRCDSRMQWICDTQMPNYIQAKCETPEEKKGLLLKQFCK